MNAFKIAIKLIIFSFIFITSIHADIVRRAAIDVGSAETKLTVADVDTETNKIIKIYYQDYKAVELRKDLAMSQDGTLSKEIEMKLVRTLNEFKAATIGFAPEQWFGVGTSVFRNAKNGQKFLDSIKTETGITIYLAAQIEEGEIGFKSAVAASGLDVDQVIAWDSGSGSFQITTMNGEQLDMYGAEFAFVPSLEVLIKRIRGEALSLDQTVNPISNDEMQQLISIIQNEKLPSIPNWLANTSKTIVTFGGSTSIFSLGQIATGKEAYTREELLAAIQKYTGKEDDQLSIFPEPKKAIVALILLYATMDHCGINEMVYKRTNGGCEGLLIIPRYWL